MSKNPITRPSLARICLAILLVAVFAAPNTGWAQAGGDQRLQDYKKVWASAAQKRMDGADGVLNQHPVGDLMGKFNLGSILNKFKDFGSIATQLFPQFSGIISQISNMAGELQGIQGMLGGLMGGAGGGGGGAGGDPPNSSLVGPTGSSVKDQPSQPPLDWTKDVFQQ